LTDVSDGKRRALFLEIARAPGNRTAARAAGARPALAIEKKAPGGAGSAIEVAARRARAARFIALDALRPLAEEARRAGARAHAQLLERRARGDALGPVQEGQNRDVACQALQNARNLIGQSLCTSGIHTAAKQQTWSLRGPVHSAQSRWHSVQIKFELGYLPATTGDPELPWCQQFTTAVSKRRQ